MGKSFKNIAIMSCMTPLLMLFNIAFWCSGMTMLIVGVYTRMQIYDYIDVDSDNSNAGAVLLAIAFLGVIVSVISLLACCCTARGHPALLYLYGGFLAVIAFLELTSGISIYTYRTTLIEGFDVGLNNSLNFYGDDSTKSQHVDVLQQTLHCCGNRAYTDWALLTPPKEIPSSCCSVPEGECDAKDINDIYTQGCYNQVVNFITSNVGLVGGGAIFIAFFPFVGVFLACCLASYINRTKYREVA